MFYLELLFAVIIFGCIAFVRMPFDFVISFQFLCFGRIAHICTPWCLFDRITQRARSVRTWVRTICRRNHLTGIEMIFLSLSLLRSMLLIEIPDVNVQFFLFSCSCRLFLPCQPIVFSIFFSLQTSVLCLNEHLLYAKNPFNITVNMIKFSEQKKIQAMSDDAQDYPYYFFS